MVFALRPQRKMGGRRGANACDYITLERVSYKDSMAWAQSCLVSIFGHVIIPDNSIQLKDQIHSPQASQLW